MVKYLQSVIDRLKTIKSGMENNATFWAGQPETTASVQTKIGELETEEVNLDEMDRLLKVKVSDAHKLSEVCNIYVEKLENLAKGVHSDSPEKLTEYAVQLRKKGTPGTKPTKIIIPVIEDDSDGNGFIVSTQNCGGAVSYHWFKGNTTDPKNTSTLPEMHPFKITSKTKFVDDDVEKGTRYYYQVHAFNSHGTIPMSEPVSRIQQ